jgi:hypothetical protein
VRHLVRRRVKSYSPVSRREGIPRSAAPRMGRCSELLVGRGWVITLESRGRALGVALLGLENSGWTKQARLTGNDLTRPGCLFLIGQDGLMEKRHSKTQLQRVSQGLGYPNTPHFPSFPVTPPFTSDLSGPLSRFLLSCSVAFFTSPNCQDRANLDHNRQYPREDLCTRANQNVTQERRNIFSG